TSPLYLDLELPAGGATRVELPRDHQAFAYVYEGAGRVGGTELPRGQLAVLGSGDHIELAAGPDGARAILVAGRPLKERVVKYGPFVMNSEQEIVQAIEDYQAGRF